jgi:hypothetical protein
MHQPAIAAKRNALLLATLALACLIVGSGSAFAAQQLAQEQMSFAAAAYGDRMVWSSFDPANSSFRLMTISNGVPVALPVPSQPKAFDVQIGPGEDGSPVAVYSRCADAGGCDLYRYDFATGAERKISGVSSSRYSETQPSIRGKKIAFVRRLKPSSGERRDAVYVGRTTGSGARRQRTPRSPLGGKVEGVTLTARGLFFVWRRYERNDPVTHAILTRVVNRRPVEIDRIGSGGAAFGQILTPTVEGSFVYYGRVVFSMGRIWRFNLRNRSFAVSISIRAAGAVALDGQRFLLSNTFDGGICKLNLNDPPSASSCTLTVTDPVSFKRSRRPHGEQT